MVKFLSSLLFLPFGLIAQSDVIHIEKEKNYFPSLSGFQTGEAPATVFCDTNGLQMRSEGEIESFDISYWKSSGMETVSINGNQIPDSICAQIGLYSLGNMVFFTNIKARVNFGTELVGLHPMNLIPVKPEDD